MTDPELTPEADPATDGLETTEQAAKPNVLLALDVGEARIGVATGRIGSTFAFGRGYITRQKLTLDVEAVRSQAEAEGATRVVVGLPSRLRGGDSPQTEKVRRFAAELEKVGLEVVFEDERLTTKLASQGLVKSGVKKKRRQEKGLLDERAAVLILESYLAKQSL